MNNHKLDASIRANPALRGRSAYEASLRAAPRYHDGTPRKAWGELSPVVRDSWNKAPRP